MSHINLYNYEAFLLDYAEGNLDEAGIQALKTFAILHPHLNIQLDDVDLPKITESNEYLNDKSALKKDITEQEFKVLMYLDNSLSNEEKIEFEKNLSSNPALKAELAMYRKANLTHLKESLSINKSNIYKQEEDLVLNNTFLLYLEGLLTNNEALAFEAELNQQPHLKAEFLVYKKTILSADQQVVFENKKALKKQNKRIVLFNTKTLLRAAAVLLLVVGIYNLLQWLKPVTVAPTVTMAQSQKKSSQPKPILPTKSMLAHTELKKSSLIQSQTKVTLNSIIAESPIDTTHGAIVNFIVKNQMATKVIDSIPQETMVVAQNTSTALSSDNNTNQLPTSNIESDKTIYTLANIEIENELEDAPATKNKFWNRLITLGNKAKNIGLKGIEAEQRENKTYFFALNQLSVEKK